MLHYYNPQFVSLITIACCGVLHNMCRQANLPIYFDDIDVENELDNEGTQDININQEYHGECNFFIRQNQ